jgi:hypothetical protein
MTMVKSAARTRLAAVGPADFLAALNEVLRPLSAPNMYVTLALELLSGKPGNGDCRAWANSPLRGKFRSGKGAIGVQLPPRFDRRCILRRIENREQTRGRPGHRHRWHDRRSRTKLTVNWVQIRCPASGEGISVSLSFAAPVSGLKRLMAQQDQCTK